MELTTLSPSELLAILDLTRRMAERRLVAPLLEYIVDASLKLIGAERGYVVLFGADGALNFRVTRDKQGHVIEDAEDQISRSVLTRIRETLAPLVLRDALNDTDFSSAYSVRNLQLRSVMCVPLISYGTVIGAIYVENRSIKGRFKPEDIAPLALFAHQAANALENATYTEQLEARVAERTYELAAANTQLEQQALELRQQMAELEALQEQLRDLSICDSLTGLHNRRFLMDTIAQQFNHARRYNRPLALIMLDIDHFKYVNDTFLHATGDQVLATIAQLLRENARESDEIARIGGEEFVVLLPETTLPSAQEYAERLRALVEDYNWQALHAGMRITISAGVAAYDTQPNYEALLHEADTCLYAAKHAGRNQVLTTDNAQLIVDN